MAIDAAGTPTLTDLCASFVNATGRVLKQFINAAPRNGGSVLKRVVVEVSDVAFEHEVAADLPANTQFLSPWMFMNNGAMAAAVAYSCSGVYVDTDIELTGYHQAPKQPPGPMRHIQMVGR